MLCYRQNLTNASPFPRVESQRRDKGSSPQDRRGGGRPRKYAEASQPVTITLPKTTLRQLEQVDPDRGRAIVKLARDVSRDAGNGAPLVELLEVGPGSGLVVVATTSILRRIAFVRLVEVTAGRHLIALLPGHGIHELEVALVDILDERNALGEADSTLVTELLELLRNFRKSDSLSTAQILLLRLGTES